MASGLKIYNQNNVLQITNEYHNMSLSDKVDVTIPASGFYDIAPGYDDIVAVNCQAPTPMWVSAYPYGNSTDQPVFATRCYGPIGAHLTLYVFRLKDNPKGKYFNVYTPTGDIAFSDNAKYLKVLQQFNGEGISGLTVLGSDNMNYVNMIWAQMTDRQLWTYTHDASILCAVTIEPMVHVLSFADNWTNFRWSLQQCFEFTTTSITSTIKRVTKNINSPITIYNNYSNLIIDVTNY